MPKFAKKSLSFLFRNDCPRQFRLSLYSDAERKVLPIPLRQQERPGAGQVGATGMEHQNKQVAALAAIFGAASVLSSPPKPGKTAPQPTPLYPTIASMTPFQFLIEGQFELTDDFKDAFGLNGLCDEWGNGLDFAALQPDILLVLPSLASEAALPPNERASHEAAISASGHRVPLDASDDRLQLRVIDVKMSADPGSHYFAEVVYYAMALASWLEARGLDDRFVVTANPSVWPGSYEKSALATLFDAGKTGVAPTQRALARAMEEDLEAAEVDVYGPPLRRFLGVRLPQMLAAPWQELEWHVNFRCQNCEFLGFPWPPKAGTLPVIQPEHCWIKADDESALSRVAGLSRGAIRVLEPVAPTVIALQSLASTAPVWGEHPTLRAKGAILRARANALGTGMASAVAGSGASATIPTFCDLKICVFLDYDAATAITAAMSIVADWREPVYDVPAGHARMTQKWGVKASASFAVGANSVASEEKQVLAFLKQLRAILDDVSAHDVTRSARNLAHESASDPAAPEKKLLSTYQLFLWDEAQFRHLKRLIERHFAAIVADKDLRTLAWLFPPDNVLPHPELASRTSPISLFYPAIEHHVAAPVPHHYTVLSVARTYLPPSATTPLAVHPLFYEPLTNLVPGERIHEFWSGAGDWMTVGQTLKETNYKKTIALSFLLSRLRRDARLGIITLGESAAPKLVPFKNKKFKNATDESQLWMEFSRLNAELTKVEAELTYALAPDEREAKFQSAHLTHRIDDPAQLAVALAQIQASCHMSLPVYPPRMVYRLAPTSRDVKLKEGDFTVALSPRSQDLFLHRSTHKAFPLYAAGLADHQRYQSVLQNDLTGVVVEAIDRQNGLISLLPGNKNQMMGIESLGDADFSLDMMLDQTGAEFLEKKVKLSLEGLGVPKSYGAKVPALGAMLDPNRALVVPHAVSLLTPAGKPRGKDKPGHDFLFWPHLTATEIYNPSAPRPIAGLLAHVKTVGASHGIALNPSQEIAFDEALFKCLTLIWGPPGTGKSATLRAILLGAVEDARQHKRALRILITANTYTAVENVLFKTEELLRALGISVPAGSGPVPGCARLFRVQSSAAPLDPALAIKHPHLLNIALETRAPDADVIFLQEALTEPTDGDIILVGAPTQQVHNLGVSPKPDNLGETQKEWFDLVILDEASQVDVASSALVFTKVAAGGACVLAGDHLQLPPIHAADAPKGMEEFVGPIFSFFVEHHALHKVPLQTNYRSGERIVEFVRRAGYDAGFHSHFADLALNLTAPLPTSAPTGWPAYLPFSPHYADLLDPNKPLVCFVSHDDRNGQANAFEAQTVAALSLLLWGNLGRAHSATHHAAKTTARYATPYGAAEFWERGVGIVAPHRAQCSLIGDALNGAFGPLGVAPQAIRAAVDMVERYQGQERDAIFASFGLGDPDLIGLEDEFLYDLNRFNVLVSRAATKALVLLSQNVVNHLADDQDVIRASRLLKNFVGQTCSHAVEIELPFYDASGALQMQSGELRWA